MQQSGLQQPGLLLDQVLVSAQQAVPVAQWHSQLAVCTDRMQSKVPMRLHLEGLIIILCLLLLEYSLPIVKNTSSTCFACAMWA